ncbi:hypothetical protein ADL29_35790 [Streptomyces chattanoogensis]|uniref:Uncharacterized protein n=1 Tax=Streptomyces chattanoogensis TaxID=66876 RepID=A0A0N1JVZ0_9ACTN|nr:hypothetical protein ADL29_35790 [Streptomyces chattanoogensis]
MPAVGRVPVAVVHVVHVIVMRYGHVAAAFPVLMGMAGMFPVFVWLALDDVVLVDAVEVAVVHVVQVAVVRYGHVAAPLAVQMGVVDMGLVRGSCRHAYSLGPSAAS